MTSKVEVVTDYLLAPCDENSGNLCIASRPALRAGKLRVIQLPPIDDIENLREIIGRQIDQITLKKIEGTLLIAHEDVALGSTEIAEQLSRRIGRTIIECCELPKELGFSRGANSFFLETLMNGNCRRQITPHIINDRLSLLVHSSHYTSGHNRHLPALGIQATSAKAIQEVLHKRFLNAVIGGNPRRAGEINTEIKEAAQRRSGQSRDIIGHFFVDEGTARENEFMGRSPETSDAALSQSGPPDETY